MTEGNPSTDDPSTASTGNGGQLRQKKRYKLGLLLALCALLGAAFLLPDLANFRYAARYRNYAQPVFCEDAVLDVAFIGTSRMAWGIEAETIAAAYRELTGDDISIVDLSRVGPTEIIFEAMMDDLIENRPVRLIIAEFNTARLSDEYWSFITKVGNVLKADDLYSQIQRIPTRNPLDHLGYFISARLRFLEASLGGIWLGCDAGVAPRKIYDHTGPPAKDRQFLKLVAKKPKAGEKPFPNDRLMSEKNHLSIEVAERLAAKARENGIEILFVNLNNMYVDQVSEDAKARFRRKVGAELATWPRAIEKTLKSENLYADKHHLDQDGSRLIAPWFARKIDQYLPREQ